MDVLEKALFIAAAIVAGAGFSRLSTSGAASAADALPSRHAITLAVPGRANATPSIAADGKTVVVVWGAWLPRGTTDVFAAVSRDGARTFAAPVQVNDVDGDARLNGEQPPRIAMRGQSITIVWTTKGAAGTRLVGARSSDGGRSFSKASTVPGGEASGNRGWQSAAVDPSGRVFTVWLDHRDLADDAAMSGSHRGHSGGTPDGFALAQKSRLFVASLDGAVPPHAITAGVCYCCKTALAADGAALYAAWRHVYPANMRDIAFAMSLDGGRSFTAPLRVSEDKWRLEGCPDDGPAVVVDRSHRVHVVWPTLVNERGADTIALFHASSPDGRSFSARERIPTAGMPHHPQLAVGSDGSIAAAWDELADGTRRAAVGLRPASAPAFTRQVVADAALYPVVAFAGDQPVLAWTSGKGEASVINVATR